MVDEFRGEGVSTFRNVGRVCNLSRRRGMKREQQRTVAGQSFFFQMGLLGYIAMRTTATMAE